MAKKNSKKIRAEFRKNRSPRTRCRDLTENFKQDRLGEQDPLFSERISGKGDLTRHRTVSAQQATRPDDSGVDVHLTADESVCLQGRVISVHGLTNAVLANDGKVYHCATRRLLKTLTTDQRHVVAAGDRVLFRPTTQGTAAEGIVERIEPRHGCLSREVRGRQHIIVTNVDQVVIVTSAAQPRLKPNLIDRLLVAAEKGQMRPVLCINKVDLVDIASLQPLVGVYSQMGYQVLLVSATTGFGIDRFRRVLAHRESVVTGQSGVGKSSLLNSAEPALTLTVATVSEENEKGRHTTTSARLIPLSFGGFVVDTPGIRQFQLWNVIAEETINYYRDLRAYVSLCRFPNCTHTHEADCAVKDAVADGRLDARRYESYCYLREGGME
jgi:ribosome biogenesis GTPase